ncbi:hypothetical protein MNJPNG_06370 [Cupriavidus oxalaticus]|uniref:hypothetical protein n=1 Tax=Cupriavidus oxalaticus TaxID=96344 RepID=UPI003F7343B8
MKKTPSSQPDAAGGAPAPQDSAVAIASDEYSGLGGSYVFDPATGKRTRVEGPDQRDPAPAATDTEEK